LATGAALIVIALPSLRLELAPADAHVLPAASEPRQVAEALTHDFAVDGSQTITIVVHASAAGTANAGTTNARATAAGTTTGTTAAKAAAGTNAAAPGCQTVAARARRAQQTAGGQASVAPPRYLGRDTWEIEMLPRGTDGDPANQRLGKRPRAPGGPP